MKFTLSPLAALALGASLLTVTAGAGAAQYDASAQVTGRAASPYEDVTENQSSGGGNYASVNDLLIGSMPASTHADAYAVIGTGGLHLGAYTYSDLIGGNSFTYGEANASGSFADQFVFSSPFAAAGSSGFATVALNISGSLQQYFWGPNASGNSLWGRSRAEWRAGIVINGVAWEGFQHVDMTNGVENGYGNAAPGTYLFNIPVVFGNTLDLYLYASVQSHSSVSNSYGVSNTDQIIAMGHASFGNTFAWGGVTELRDANGALITDFTAVSATSGFDYANAYVSAVPVPAAIWLMGSGLLGLIGMARRKAA